jgi:hypothetical protein
MSRTYLVFEYNMREVGELYLVHGCLRPPTFRQVASITIHSKRQKYLDYCLCRDMPFVIY